MHVHAPPWEDDSSTLLEVKRMMTRHQRVNVFCRVKIDLTNACVILLYIAYNWHNENTSNIKYFLDVFSIKLLTLLKLLSGFAPATGKAAQNIAKSTFNSILTQFQ